MTALFHLHVPSAGKLPAYTEALRRGWSPDNTRPEASAEELLESKRTQSAF